MGASLGGLALHGTFSWQSHSLPGQAQGANPRPAPTPMKTNAVRQLERLGIPHELRDYAVDPDDLSAESVAAKVNMPAEQVFKTLVVRGDRNGVCLAVVPGDCELDLKALARLTGDRKVEPVAMKELQPLTGYIRGGVTALGCRKNYPVYLDDSALVHLRIAISAGIRGTQIVLSPQDYRQVTGASTGSIARSK